MYKLVKFTQHTKEFFQYSTHYHTKLALLALLLCLLVTDSLVTAIFSQPKFSSSLTNQTALEKRIVNLYCEAEGSPQPSIVWFKDNQEIDKKDKPISKFEKGSLLRLDYLRKKDEGYYECQIGEGSEVQRIGAFVKVLSLDQVPTGFPKITTQPPDSMAVRPNSTAEIPCVASGHSKISYSWLFKGRPIEYFPDFSKKYEILDGTLKIFNVTEIDKGEYECQASNDLGVETSEISKLKTELRQFTPDPPKEIKWRLTSPIDAVISWTTPIIPNARVDGNITQMISYQVLLTKVGTFSGTKYDINVNRLILNELSENAEYTLKVRTIYQDIYGPFSPAIKIITPKDVPPPPPNVKASANSYNSAMVWWDNVAYFSGVTGFRIYYIRADIDEPDYDNWDKKNISLTNSVIINNLVENVSYSVKVCVVVGNFIGKLSESVKVIVKPLEVVYDLKVGKVTTHSASLSWKAPLELIPAKYKISYEGRKEFYDSNGRVQTPSFEPQTKYLSGNETRILIDNLMPWTFYKFNVTALNQKEHFKPPASVTFTTSKAAPKPMLQPTYLGIVGTIGNIEGIEISLPTASEEYGPISSYYVITVPADMPPVDTDTLSIEDLKNSTKNGPYVAAKMSRSKMLKKFILGDNQHYEGYRNNILKKDQEYKIFVRAVVDGESELFSDSSYSDILSLKPPSPTTSSNQNLAKYKPLLFITLGIVLVFLFLGAIFLKRQKQELKTNQINETTMRLLPDPTIYSTATIDANAHRRINHISKAANIARGPIPISELENLIEYLKLDNNLKEEFESIEPGQLFTWDHSSLEHNKPKNRYQNVVAYDHSRVVLKTIDNIPGSDYINANYCDGYQKPNQYVATQGPLPSTVGDFWRMVWEQKSRTIVMMTQLQERGKVKCVQYWPSRDSVTYHGITIGAGDVEELAYYNIRNLTLKYQSEVRKIKQFQFTAWPDHGVPDHPTPFLMFLKRIKLANPPEAGPMIVLCSAGVGRTGCFMVIDSMIERIKHESTIDIYGQVTSLRAQRNYIVQIEEQYMFIHDAVLEAIISTGTEVPITKLTEHFHKLMQTIPGSRATGLEIEFKKLGSLRFSNQKFISASLPCNKHKNRLMNIMPYESTRVCLEHITGIEGSDYINANFCDGYKNRNAYIATQGPLPHTVDDFWRMTFEHNSGIIVMLTDLKEMGKDKCTQYWPAERYGDYHPFRVELEQEYDTSDLNYVLREFKIIDTRDLNYMRKIRQFHFLNWTEQIERNGPKSIDFFINFIAEIHRTKQKFGLEGPITVHCSGGVGRTGVFIALSIALERLQNEGYFGMFETVRTLRTQRPAMVQTEEQYLFCYQTAMEYVKNFERRSSR